MTRSQADTRSKNVAIPNHSVAHILRAVLLVTKYKMFPVTVGCRHWASVNYPLIKSLLISFLTRVCIRTMHPLPAAVAAQSRVPFVLSRTNCDLSHLHIVTN